MIKIILFLLLIMLAVPFQSTAEIIKLVCDSKNDSQSFTINTARRTVVDKAGAESNNLSITNNSFNFSIKYPSGEVFVFMISRANGFMRIMMNSNEGYINVDSYKCKKSNNNDF